MSYWNIKPNQLIATIPQLSDDDYPVLRRILLLHRQHLEKCEEMLTVKHDFSFEKVLRCEGEYPYNLYMDLLSRENVLMRSISSFAMSKELFQGLSNEW